MAKSQWMVGFLVLAVFGCAPAQLVRTERVGPGEECAAGGLAVHLGTDVNVDGILGDDEIATTDYVCDAVIAMVRVDSEAPGMNCDAGGIAVHTGVDVNGDGSLDDTEITTTDYVCNAGAGLGPGQPLVEVAAEPAGENCPDGGIQVTSGIDEDGNGVLEGEELLDTSYVCNGSSGVAGLVRIDDEPEGANCAEGGLAIGMGLDLDASGELEPGEVVSTSYVCHGDSPPGGVLTGGITVTNSYDLWILSLYEEVTDYVTFCGNDLAEIVLPDLALVGGDFQFNRYREAQGSSSDCTHELLALVDFPALTDVGGVFYAPRAEGVTDLTGLSALQSVGGIVQIGETSLTSLDGLQQLATLGGDLAIHDNADLTDITALSALTSVPGNVSVTNNPLLCQTDVEAWLGGVTVAGYTTTAGNGE